MRMKSNGMERIHIWGGDKKCHSLYLPSCIVGVAVHHYVMTDDDMVEAHCYFVDIGRTDREQICSRINNNGCRTFQPQRPLSKEIVQMTETSCNHCY